jgi:hypothetical protein
MFDVIKGVGSSIKNIASMASKKLANVVDGAKKSISGDDTKVKKTDAEIEADKKAAAKRKNQMDLFKKADQLSMKNYNAAQKAAKEMAEKAAKEGLKDAAEKSAKETAELVAKSATKSAIKKVPIIGIAAGLFFGLQRALEGEFVKAGGEVMSGVLGTFAGPGTVAAMGIDATMLADDLGAFDGKKTSINGENIEPDPSRPTSGGVFMGPQLYKGGDNYQSVQTFTMEGMNDGNMQFGTSMLVK